MKALAVSAFAVGLTGGLVLEAQSQDRPRHVDAGEFTLSLGETADLTEEHIPLAFVTVWPHPFGDRAINISVNGQSYSVGAGAVINLKSPYSRLKSGTRTSVLAGKVHCNLEIVDFDNPQEGGAPKVTFRLDCA
jgi:hypothetical protein